ncbi:hypothetical protein [Kribbella sancticallisti]
MNYDEPMTRDPLFWAGIAIGVALGVTGVVVQDHSGWDAVWRVILSTISVVWVGTGLIGTSVREFYRHRRDRRADIELLLKEDAVLKETE